jgi:hypothetical protein
MLRCLPAPVSYALLSTLRRWFGKPHKGCRYLHPSLTIADFFSAMNERAIQYAVLDWFDERQEPAENDLRILIADNDLNKCNDLFSWRTSAPACTFYTVTGVGSARYRKIPILPPHIASQVLETRQLGTNGYYVPSGHSLAVSFVYHLVFHATSRAFSQDLKQLHGKYAHALTRCFSDAGVPAPEMSFSGLHDFLKRYNAVPALDVRRKLAIHDPLLMAMLPSAIPLDNGEVMAFILREWVIKHEYMKLVVDLLRKQQLEIIFADQFTAQQKDRAKNLTRGGRWNRSNHNKDGTDPAAIIVCFDPYPTSPTPEQRQKHPFITNARLNIKRDIRHHIRRRYSPFWSQPSIIHSADDELEAWEYISAILPEHVSLIEHRVLAIRNAALQAEKAPSAEHGM